MLLGNLPHPTLTDDHTTIRWPPKCLTYLDDHLLSYATWPDGSSDLTIFFPSPFCRPISSFQALRAYYRINLRPDLVECHLALDISLWNVKCAVSQTKNLYEQTET